MKRKRRNQVLDWTSARLLQGLLGCLARAPEGPAYFLASLAGKLFWRISPSRRERALENLFLALGEKASPALAKESFSSLMKVALDFVRLPSMLRRGEFAGRVDFSGFTPLLEEAGEGGVIFVTGHLGSWEVGGVALARRRGELHVIARRVENPYLDRLVFRGRTEAGLVVHPRRGGMRPLARALKEGKDAGVLLDQNQRKRGIFVPVFGRLASTDRSAAALAFRLGRPVVVGFALREGKGFRFRMVPGGLLRPTPGEKEGKDLEGFTRRIVEAMEKIILRFPGQYLWLHNRYRTRPPGEE